MQPATPIFESPTDVLGVKYNINAENYYVLSVYVFLCRYTKCFLKNGYSRATLTFNMHIQCKYLTFIKSYLLYNLKFNDCVMCYLNLLAAAANGYLYM